ncbi:hypothetical protein FSP39_011566 [Pinctada imbricata]|uniref:Heat shock 70 kDa protein n=1 Tax=Pinctada imbricata TaxID=66713 RepID=A0AA89BVG2_PINIB|nr:hypothetical protein FSP39_011566 [Pinctada imbricata]
MSKHEVLLSVAIDFGTTYSGYAFSTKGDFEIDPTKIYANEDWPAGNIGFSRKTPTVLLLDSNQEFVAFGFEAEQMYNQLAVDQEHEEYYYFRRFKMKLHGEKVVKNDLMLEDETGKKVNAEKVFAESIRYLKQHFLKMLNNQGKVIDDSEIQYTLTVPAIWNDSSKQFMRNAAKKAGIDVKKLKIALEPEAAAFFCQYEKTKRNENTFAAAEIGTKYMVIDLGGGTVDIALHQKLENGRIKELYQASGGPYGGTAVDEVYIQLLTRAFGGPMMYQFRKENTYDFLDMMKEFEVAKRNLKPSGRLSFNTRLPYSFGLCCKEQNDETLAEIVSENNFPFKGNIKVIGDKLSIKADLMLQIFSTVTAKITDLIQEVLSQPVAEGCQILLLVGGFSESEYVQQAIKDKFETEERRVIVPAEAGLTVVKGATIFGHKKHLGIVTERVIRYTYGIATDTEFDAKQHNPEYKFRIRNKDFIHTFLSFMEKGTSVKEGTVIKKQYEFEEFTRGAGITIYSTTRDVKFIQEGGLEKLVRINVDKDAEKFFGKKVTIEVSYTFGDTELEILVHCPQTGNSFRANVAKI